MQVILTSSSVRNSRGMHTRREHLPFPVKQRILWSSHLKGMERPVRSFKSFIRTVPPNPGIESQKPLPPIPSSPQSPETEVSIEPTIISSPNRGTSFAPWQAPSEWEWDISTSLQPINTTSIFPNRKYLPLLPEPSTGPFDMQGEICPGVLDTYDTQPGPLDVGFVAMEDRPEPPPRNPSRLSSSRRTSGQSGSDSLTTSVPKCNKSSLSPSIDSETRRDLPTTSQLHTDVPAFTHLSYSAPDASTKAKAFASLGIGSPRNSKNPWVDWTNRPESSLIDEDGPHLLILRGKNLRPLIGSDISGSQEAGVPELNEKLQQLSFSQDYHDVLARCYHDSYPHLAEMPIHPVSRTTPRPRFCTRGQSPRKEQEMIPRPLAWRKSSESSSSSDHSRRTPPAPKKTTISRPKRMHKKMASWAPLQHLYTSDRRPVIAGGALLHSDSETSIPRVSPIRLAENMSSKKPNRFPNLLAHAKGLRSHKHCSRPDNSTTIILGSPQQSLGPVTSTTLAEPSGSTTPLLRLPGGLALVRRAPSDKLRPRTPNISHPTPFVDAQNYDLYMGSPIPTSSAFRRPSSSYSQSSGASPVAPGLAINSRMRNSICSLPSNRPHSSTSSLPSSPLAQEVFFPQIPPPHLPKKHLQTPPISTSNDEHHFESFLEDETAENSPHRQGLLEKARDVRDAWKRHQKEVKHEKLKQSIRVLGPLDLVNMERRSKREASVLVHSDSNRRVPESEYVVSNPI